MPCCADVKYIETTWSLQLDSSLASVTVRKHRIRAIEGKKGKDVVDIEVVELEDAGNPHPLAFAFYPNSWRLARIWYARG